MPWVPGLGQKKVVGGAIVQTGCTLVNPEMAIGESTLNSLLIGTSRDIDFSTECWLVIGDSCKDVVTSPATGGEVTLLAMSISLPILSWAVTPHDLATRLRASKRS